MEIVDFSSKTFGEIPKQDNPAFMTKAEFEDAGQIEGCVLITKQDQSKPPYKNRGRFVVMKITPVENPEEEESVNMIGLFWELEYAVMFSNLIATESKAYCMPEGIDTKEKHEQYLKDIGAKK